MQRTDGTPIALAAVLQNDLIWNVGMARPQFADGVPNGGSGGPPSFGLRHGK